MRRVLLLTALLFAPGMTLVAEEPVDHEEETVWQEEEVEIDEDGDGNADVDADGTLDDVNDERGWRVFAADFDEAALAAIGEVPGITALRVDVTDTASIEAAGEVVQEAVGGLDGIVNFAGILAVGSLVELEEAALARVLDVNVMGILRIHDDAVVCNGGRQG